MTNTAGSDPLGALVKAARTPLSDWPAQYPDLIPMGYLCGYVPEEIIDAAGFVPVRVRGNSEPLRQVDAHLQSFTCALCRSSLDQVLDGSLDVLAGTIFAHTCDAMQALADLWRFNTATHFVDTVMQPASMGSQAAHAYLVGELERFRDRLADFASTTISDEKLRASIDLYDDTRRLIAQLHDWRGHFSIPDYYAILDAAQVMPRRSFNPLLSALLDIVKDGPHRAAGPRLFLVGAVLDEPRLLNLIAEAGAQVVGDDLCSGSRHFYGAVGRSESPITALAHYYQRRPPCPTKIHPTHDPGHHLLEQSRQVRAQGIVFVLEKFCEPHAFDYAIVLPTLDRAGLPHLMLEMEQTPSIEALRTRIQAFVEML